MICLYIYMYTYTHGCESVIVLGSFRGAPDVCDAKIRPQQTCGSAPSMGR